MLVFLIIVWGWVLLLLLAGLLAAKLPWKAGLPLAAVLLLIALPWFWETRSATFGIQHAAVLSPSGHEVWLEHQGFWTFIIHVRRNGRIFDMPYISGQDTPRIQHVRWITDSLLAVDRAGSNDFVFDLDIYEYVTWEGRGQRGPKPNFDPALTQPWQRDPLTEEQTFFTNE